MPGKLQKIRDKYYYLNYGEESISSFLKKSTYEKVLDIGCGTGRDLALAKKYAKSNNVELHGVDLKPEPTLLEKDRHKIKKVDLERQRLPYPDESFDIVIANQLLEHVKEIFWISNEACRVLKTKGRLIIGIPNLAALHNRLLLFSGRHPTCIKLQSAHVRGFTRGSLVNFYQNIGELKLLQVRGENLYPFPPLISKFLTRLFPNIAVSLFFLFEKTKIYQGNFVDYLKQNKLETMFFKGK